MSYRDKGQGIGSKFCADRCDGIGSPKQGTRRPRPIRIIVETNPLEEHNR